MWTTLGRHEVPQRYVSTAVYILCVYYVDASEKVPLVDLWGRNMTSWCRVLFIVIQQCCSPVLKENEMMLPDVHYCVVFLRERNILYHLVRQRRLLQGICVCLVLPACRVVGLLTRSCENFLNMLFWPCQCVDSARASPCH